MSTCSRSRPRSRAPWRPAPPSGCQAAGRRPAAEVSLRTDRYGAGTTLAGRWPGAAALLLALALTGCAGGDPAAQAATPAPTGPAPTAAGAATPPPIRVPDAVRSFRSTQQVRPVAPPVRITIPAAGVDSGLERLGRQPDGTVEVPHDWQSAGWYASGPRPGERGAAVVLGHIDSPTGPAVFARLPSLRRGDRVDVRRDDGSLVRFVVDRVEQHARSRFPAVEVYWPTLAPELRLITCGGPYIRSAGGYQDNVIVFATVARP